MPWPSHWFVFLLMLLPVTMLAVVWHEAGHVLAARCAGLRVTAWGVGFRRPWFHARLGRATFYLGHPFSAGLTLFLRPCIERQPLREFITIAGGPLATLFGLALGLMLWSRGLRADALVAWIFVSSVFCFLSCVPFTGKSGPLRIRNDASQLIDILRFGRQAEYSQVAATLSTVLALAELLEQIQCDAGAAYMNCWASIIESSVGDIAAARERLRRAESTQPELHGLAGLLAYAQATVAVSEADETAETRLVAARELCHEDPLAGFGLDCMRLRLLMEQGQDIRDDLNLLRERAVAVSRQDWQCAAESMLFEATTDCDAPETSCRDLIQRYPRYLSTTAKVQLLGIATERLAIVGDTRCARALFAEAQTAIAAEASLIRSEQTRRAFTTEMAKPLQRALAATADGDPIFIPDLAAKNDQPANRREVFANITLAIGFAAATATGCAVPLALEHELGHAASGRAMFFLTLCMLASLISGLISVLRRERRWRRLLTGLALVGASIVAAVALLEPLRDTY